MPRAHRHYLPAHVWHLTHRCHQRQFLFRFLRDRLRWMSWLQEGRKRFGLCILNYTVTSNHIHLLVRDRGRGEIARSMQLIAGRTAQEYNQRKGRCGAFWEDRYHATAVEASAEALARCLVYIDMNMVRAGVVSHPAQWQTGGYREIQEPPSRYRIVDLAALMEVLQIDTVAELRQSHREAVAEVIRARSQAREGIWSESLAVGSEGFVQRVKQELGLVSQHREVERCEGAVYRLRDAGGAYRVHSGVEMGALSS